MNPKDCIIFEKPHRHFILKLTKVWIAILFCFLAIPHAWAADRPLASGHVPRAVRRLNLRSTNRLTATNRIDLAIGLPLRNPERLQQLLAKIYDPNSPQYHQYLTPAQFAAQFGPTPEQYEAVKSYAQSNHLVIAGTHANRLILDVNGSADDIERAFHIQMMTYPHPTEARTFYAPDTEPTVPTDLPILDVSGLDDYAPLQPAMFRATPLSEKRVQTPNDGTGPQGSFQGNDFRVAYVPGVSLTGAGQSVGLLEFDGFYAKDISAYEVAAGIPPVPITKVLVDGFKGSPGKLNGEVALDIEMVVSMAPGLSKVIVYEGPNKRQSYNDLINQIAADNLVAQISSSWLAPSGPDATTDQIFQQFAAQGQSFFQASGDSGAFPDAVAQPADNPYITVVGGTSLSFDSAGGIYYGESVWNAGGGGATGGGISTTYSIPAWQAGIDMSANQGSATMRNLPDVAMAADNIHLIADNGKHFRAVGTSASAPLWAAFNSLVNQQAASNGLPNIGFAAPALYAIARGPNYNVDFHDVTAGNNTSGASPDRFFAVPGFDLCSGWGTPAGQNLIDDLTTQRSRLRLAPEAGFAASGIIGGPFDVTNEDIFVGTTGWVPFTWSLINTSQWLNASITTGTVTPAAPTAVSISLAPSAYNLSPGVYETTLLFSNAFDATLQSRSFTLQVYATGAVQVAISPADAVAAGARWRVDGGLWRDSGTTLPLQIGSHLLEFSDVPDWTKPPSQSINISSNETTLLAAEYLGQGALQVSINPPHAESAGGKWQVDGGSWQTNGAVVTGLTVGEHTLAFSDVANWATPPSQTVIVSNRSTTIAQGVYVAQTGSLQVNITGLPQNPDLYLWAVDGGAAQPSGTILTGLSIGTHTVTFQPFFFGCTISTPPAQTVTIYGEQLTSISANYVVKTGSMQVTLNPPSAVAAGAKWQLDGGPWHNSGETVPQLTACYYHTLTFSTVNGFTTPYQQYVFILADSQTPVTASATYAGPFALQVTLYPPAAVAAGAQWRVDGGPWQASGATVPQLSPTGHTVEFSRVSGWAAPSAQVVTDGSTNAHTATTAFYGAAYTFNTIGGLLQTIGTNDGVASASSFNSPMGVTFDSSGNIFVVDSGNSTIRKLTSDGTNWTATTIAGLAGVTGGDDGTNSAARFNQPQGIAMDTNGNFFVADSGNCTIRMLVLDGTNCTVSTIAGLAGNCGNSDGIGADARFHGPSGITIAADGALYVVDSGNFTIRKLVLQGTNWLVTTIAGRGYNWAADDIGTNAGFESPSGITAGTNGHLYVVDPWRIRELTPVGTNWSVGTAAGQAFNRGLQDGLNENGLFWAPSAIAPDNRGGVFITDYSVVRKMEPVGPDWLVSSVGAFENNPTNGVVEPTGFYYPGGIATDFRGRIVVADTALQSILLGTPFESGSLAVTLAPDAAVQAGARWRLDQGPWQSNVMSLDNITLGDHTITFFGINNWTTPAPQPFTVHSNETVSITGNYAQQFASLQFSLLPADAVAAGAQWRVDEGSWQTNQAIVSGLAAGNHVVTFADLDAWKTPLPQSIVLAGQQSATITAGYVPQGSLHTAITPAAVVAAGAMWRVDGGAWQPDGVTVSNLDFGSHTLSFSSVDGWTASRDLLVNITSQQTVMASGFYLADGSLQVIINPAGIDAKWNVDGGDWQTNGATVILSPGVHFLGFPPLTDWLPPTNVIVPIISSQLKIFNAVYSPRTGGVQVFLGPTNAVADGVQWQVDSGAWQNSGDIFAVLPGSHVVGFKPVTGWNTPSNQIVITDYSTNSIAADYTPNEPIVPTVSFLTPSTTNDSWHYPQLTVYGTAHDNFQVEKVWCRINSGEWMPVHGTTNWNLTMMLPIGANKIYAYAVDASGNQSATKSISADYAPMARLNLKTLGAGTVSPNLNGQLLTVGSSYKLTAKAQKGSLFSHWSGDASAFTPTLTFVMQTNTALQANFVTNPFPSVAGTYVGLFQDTNNIGGLSGYFRATVTSSGKFTAKLQTGASSLSLSGLFSGSGMASNSISRKKQTPLFAELLIDLNGADTITGEISDGTSTAVLTADRANSINPAPQAGKYTLVIPGIDPVTGHGYGNLSVDNIGNVQLSSTLADGAKVTQSSVLSKNGELPLYIPLYSGLGSLYGRLTLANTVNADLTGTVFWVKPAQPAAAYYPQGFTNVMQAIGSRFQFTNGVPLLGAGMREISFSAGDLPFTNNVALTVNNTITNLSPNDLKLNFTTASGYFQGTVTSPLGGSPFTIGGVVLQKQDAAYGSLFGTNQSGPVELKSLSTVP